MFQRGVVVVMVLQAVAWTAIAGSTYYVGRQHGELEGKRVELHALAAESQNLLNQAQALMRPPTAIESFRIYEAPPVQPPVGYRVEEL